MFLLVDIVQNTYLFMLFMSIIKKVSKCYIMEIIDFYSVDEKCVNDVNHLHGG